MSKGPELKSITGGKVLPIHTGRDYAKEIADKFEVLARELFFIFDEAANHINPRTNMYYLDKHLSEHIKSVIQAGCETLIASIDDEIKEYASDD